MPVRCRGGSIGGFHSSRTTSRDVLTRVLIQRRAQDSANEKQPANVATAPRARKPSRTVLDATSRCHRCRTGLKP